MSATAIIEGPPTYHSHGLSEASANIVQHDDLGVPIHPGDDLPEYRSLNPTGAVQTTAARLTARPAPKEFEYKIESKGKSIVVMNIMADPVFSKNIPTFSGLGPVKGNVRLDLDKPEGVQSIVVSVIGRHMSGIEDEHTTFLELSRTLWSQGEDIQRTTHPDSNYGGIRLDGKLQGNYIWAFAFDIPAELTLPAVNSGNISFCPPQTFSERALHGSVKYMLSVKVTRGRLRPDHKITVPIGYIPVIRPPAFPPLRLLAYQEGTPLLGPEIDPEGWHALEPVQIKGLLFTTRPVEVTCTLFLANPLSYTRGSVIPLYMRLTSKNQQAVDLWRNPKAIVVRLQRRIISRVPQKTLKNLDYENLHRTQGKDARDMINALWWSPTQITDTTSLTGEHMRDINGEIHLGGDLKPSSDMPYFRIEYAVVLYPFTAVGLEASGGEKVHREQKVEIVTSFAPGPRAVRAAPPGYDATIQPQALGEAFTALLSGLTGFL